MGLVIFDEKDADNPVTPQYSTGTGQVLRGEDVELTKISFKEGFGAEVHQHPEEQVVYILEGIMQFTVDGETYDVHPGQASYHAPNVPHGTLAKTDVVALSFKKLVDPIYGETGKLE
jgi:quercetin dioxygenase-like cupin family protein